VTGKLAPTDVDAAGLVLALFAFEFVLEFATGGWLIGCEGCSHAPRNTAETKTKTRKSLR
jgi:hypothetical protein